MNIYKKDGSLDYTAMIEYEKEHPFASLTDADLKASLQADHAKELQRISTMTMAEVAAEKENELRNWRERAEANGRVLQEQERQRLADLLEAKRLEAESNPTPITDREIAAKKAYDDAMAAIAERAAQPVKMTESELQAAHARKTELLDRYTKARDASLKPNVDVGKF